MVGLLFSTIRESGSLRSVKQQIIDMAMNGSGGTSGKSIDHSIKGDGTAGINCHTTWITLSQGGGRQCSSLSQGKNQS